MKNLSKNGFGLVETLVGVAVFVLIATAAYGGFIQIMKGVQILRIKAVATNLANEQIEIIKNLPYTDVGIVNGLPPGKIPREQFLTRSGLDFLINTSIRDIDDPFDGQIGGAPNDLSPADYKLAEITISCHECKLEEELKYYARVASLNLETQGNNGALFVQVLDANGQPLQGADVHIENNIEGDINIDETTNNDGVFQIVDAPVGTEAYEITISKGDDYSVDKTYTIGDPENPVPDRPHSNVASGLITQTTFAIDKLSEVDVYTRQSTCERIASVDFSMHGSKTIGLDIYKYDFDEKTNSSGYLNLEDVEWDNYEVTITDTGWDLAGSSPTLPLQVNPDSSHIIDLILARKEPNALLVKILDSETMLPVSGAEVNMLGGGNDITLTTGRGFMTQTDWSGGGGQQYYADNETRYLSKDSGIDISTEGQLTLAEFGESHSASGILESSIFDTGTTANYGNIFWNPVDQPLETGDDPIRIQIATNFEITEETVWNFVGPDGTADTYYTNSGEGFAGEHFGDRYLKYKIYLQSDSSDHTPLLANLSFTFLSECAPPGQVFFTALDIDEYTLSVDHEDYQQSVIEGFIVDSEWAEYEINLVP